MQCKPSGTTMLIPISHHSPSVFCTQTRASFPLKPHPSVPNEHSQEILIISVLALSPPSTSVILLLLYNPANLHTLPAPEILPKHNLSVHAPNTVKPLTKSSLNLNLQNLVFRIPDLKRENHTIIPLNRLLAWKDRWGRWSMWICFIQQEREVFVQSRECDVGARTKRIQANLECWCEGVGEWFVAREERIFRFVDGSHCYDVSTYVVIRRVGVSLAK
ncbi:uncharacterized protein LY89DRAFT_301839 [Mollisia scopiformis]|uniref:Uncharacterized protein n=1 Tax=Mollisia scopiformis TaxID=149040 RepID=A0A194XS09_MOLSC|nr:uncharacterized protein LY89DRAFT_301839 [Mollisia scopiformis]KUJ22512.1 hypothetical protein LY89DRAFT_301839 [Mollisia scopiformis]